MNGLCHCSFGVKRRNLGRRAKPDKNSYGQGAAIGGIGERAIRVLCRPPGDCGREAADPDFAQTEI